MTSRSKTIVAAACFAAVCVSAHAYDSQNNYALDGPGKIDCATFTEIVRAGDRRLDIVAGWTQGYLSAHNRLLSDTYDLTPWQTTDTILNLAGQFCVAHPDRTFEASLVALMRALTATRTVEKSQIVRVGLGEDFVLVYEDTLRKAQAALSRAGFDPTGDAETFGASVRAYQSSKGLDANGLLDQPTLASLLPLAQPAAQ